MLRRRSPTLAGFNAEKKIRIGGFLTVVMVANRYAGSGKPWRGLIHLYTRCAHMRGKRSRSVRGQYLNFLSKVRNIGISMYMSKWLNIKVALAPELVSTV